ncbi:MAG: hypothetical protein ACR2NU_16455 [Aeoliella sp.]
MKHKLHYVLLALTFGGSALHATADVASVGENVTTWETPTANAIEDDIRSWLVETAESTKAGEQLLVNVEPNLALLHADSDRLDVVAHCLAAGSPAIANLVASCEQSPPLVESTEWLASDDVPEFVRTNVRLFAGRALVRDGYYEQALGLLENGNLSSAADPAALLFYRAICEHQLVKIEDARSTLSTLIATEETLPPRFDQLARLMQSDIARVEVDSLDHIARRMSDVRRRLGLGQAGQRAQEVERGILASLDKVIEQAEQQQRKQQQQQQAGRQPSGTPMEESKPAELKGEGKVDIKEIGKQSGWGDLPPRERERVMQQISRDFPSHYSDLIEEYLRRLATDERADEEP